MATHTADQIEAQAKVMVANDGYTDPNLLVLPFTTAPQVKTPMGLCLAAASAVPLWTLYTSIATSVLDAASEMQSA